MLAIILYASLITIVITISQWIYKRCVFSSSHVILLFFCWYRWTRASWMFSSVQSIKYFCSSKFSNVMNCYSVSSLSFSNVDSFFFAYVRASICKMFWFTRKKICLQTTQLRNLNSFKTRATAKYFAYLWTELLRFLYCISIWNFLSWLRFTLSEMWCSFLP